MTALRFDATPWIAGALVFGVGSFGVLAQTIPGTGQNGPAYAYNDLSFPGDNGKEICGRLTSLPSAGTFSATEDTSFAFSGAPDGVYTATYQLYVDGTPQGSAIITLDEGVVPSVGGEEYGKKHKRKFVRKIDGKLVVFTDKQLAERFGEPTEAPEVVEVTEENAAAVIKADETAPDPIDYTALIKAELDKQDDEDVEMLLMSL